MYITFDQLPPEARVWVYQASRPLTELEITATLPGLARFAEEWTSHGHTLHASATVLHQQFLVFGLDEGIAGASGCSIDASVRFVAQLENLLGVEFLDKSRLAFFRDGTVQLLSRNELKAAVAARTVASGTLYFDSTLATKGDLDAKWPRPAGQTWLARYFGPEEKRGTAYVNPAQT